MRDKQSVISLIKGKNLINSRMNVFFLVNNPCFGTLARMNLTSYGSLECSKDIFPVNMRTYNMLEQVKRDKLLHATDDICIV